MCWDGQQGRPEASRLGVLAWLVVQCCPGSMRCRFIPMTPFMGKSGSAAHVRQESGTYQQQWLPAPWSGRRTVSEFFSCNFFGRTA